MKRLLLLTVLLIYGILPGKAQRVEDGHIDLSEVSFEKEGTRSLSGNWRFYWNQLLDPAQARSARGTTMRVPGSWHRSGYSIEGYATYAMSIRLSGSTRGLSLYFPMINTSARIFLNGVETAASGVVGESKEKASPRLGRTIFSLPDSIREVDLVVQVSNFNYYVAGIDGSPQIGRTDVIQGSINRTVGIENFFAGCLLALFLYQMILYVMYQRGMPYLWLALICLGVALRAMTTHGGSFLLPELFPSVPYDFWKKLEFGSVYAIVALFPLYVHHLFRPQSREKVVLAFVAVSLILVMIVVVTKQIVYGRVLDVAHITLLLEFFFAVWVIATAWRHGNRDARVILFGVVACFPFILLEILKNSAFFQLSIPFMYLVEIGVLLFLVFQVYLLASHFAKSYRGLEQVNAELEKKVELRTRELQQSNQVKERLLSVISHDVRSPINALHGMLQILNKGVITPDEFKDQSIRIEQDLNATGLMVDNVLAWTSGLLRGVHVRVERIAVMPAVKEVFSLFENQAAVKRIQLQARMKDGFEILADRQILHLVLRNLVSNAVKFSHEGGEVIVQADRKNGVASLEVRDSGVGMDEKTVVEIFSMQSPSREGTALEKGTGLGLSLSRNFLLKAGATLSAESVPGKGSVFRIDWPQ